MARNWIAENFKGDWVLMLDTDHLFEPDVLVRLKHAADQLKADVVSAVYVQKSAPFRPTLFNFDEKTEKLSFVAAWDREAQGVLNVNCAGAGTLFIRRKVFDAIYASGELPFTMFPPSSAHPFGLGEDFSFFLRLKRLGIPVYAVPQIESFHIQPWPLSLADYQMPECSAPTANQTLP
jgi:GT2 family glycosyltransferase